jgi:uncharacterized membrane protein
MDFREQVAGKTDQELIDIYINPQDYQENFVQAVIEELTRRNVSLKSYQQERDQKQKFISETLEKGKQGDPLYITLGFISAFLGGFIGIIAGYIYSQSKDKTTSQKYYVYNEQTRKQGVIMMFIGIFVLLITLIWKSS